MSIEVESLKNFVELEYRLIENFLGSIKNLKTSLAICTKQGDEPEGLKTVNITIETLKAAYKFLSPKKLKKDLGDVLSRLSNCLKTVEWHGLTKSESLNYKMLVRACFDNPERGRFPEFLVSR